MMTKEKTTLLQQMEQQRFSPITPETLSLYHAYESIIDQHDTDDLTYLLFYQGEYYFRTGDFNQSLNLLTRCLHAPKSPSLLYLDTLAYNIIGLIYSYLGQETISIDYLLHARDLSIEINAKRETAICCANLCFFYNQLEILDIALSYIDEAIATTQSLGEQSSILAIPFYAYRGILYCKLGDYDNALECLHQMELLHSERSHQFYTASILNFYIRLYEINHDDGLLKEYLEKFSSLVTSSMDFLPLSEYHFDVCNYLLEKDMKAECASLLNHIQPFCMESPLIFLRYNYIKQQIRYHQKFSEKTEYMSYCEQIIALLPLYHEERNQSKLHSLTYIEHIRKTKDDSETYREKSRIDQMTGLLNKYTIQFLVEEDLSKHTSSHKSAMLLIDLDHFKQINDSLGHLVGDSFICQTASVIQNYFKADTLCGRIGGDEFLVYINNALDSSAIILQAELLRQEIARQTCDPNTSISTQASIGIAFSSDDCYNYESLFSSADKALYRAKLEGRNKVIVAE